MPASECRMDDGMIVSLIEGPDGTLGFHAYDPAKHPDGAAALRAAFDALGTQPVEATKSRNLLNARRAVAPESKPDLRAALARIAAWRQAPAPTRKDTGPTMASVVRSAAAQAGHDRPLTPTTKCTTGTVADALARMRAGGPR